MKISINIFPMWNGFLLRLDNEQISIPLPKKEFDIINEFYLRKLSEEQKEFFDDPEKSVAKSINENNEEMKSLAELMAKILKRKKSKS